ncbi:MAG: hypothetical protein ACPKPY_07240 [Nitrososphaeraceae archaeon]
MKTKFKIEVFSIAVILTVSLIASTNLENQIVFAQEKIEGKLTLPTEENPLFGGNESGTIEMEYNENNVSIMAQLDNPPSEGMVYEGWLVDTDIGYALSTGQLDENNAQTFEQVMVNPYIHNVYVITEEPIEDTDPQPNIIHVGGFELPDPFGQ